MARPKIIDKIDEYKSNGTSQFWVLAEEVDFSNEYITLKRIDSSNVAGGASVYRGKQWSIIIEIKKSFTMLKGWKELKNYYGNDLQITPVLKGALKGCVGIRFYKMSSNPNKEIIYDILTYIFN